MAKIPPPPAERELKQLAKVVKQMNKAGAGFDADDVALIASTRADVLRAERRQS